MSARLASVTRPRVTSSALMRRLVYEVTRFVREAQMAWLLLLVGMTVVNGVLTYVLNGAWPLNVYLIPLLLAMNVMPLSRLLFLDLVTALCLAFSFFLIEWTWLRVLGLIAIVLAGLIITLHTRARTRLGILPLRGDSMLVDLRDRLASQSQLPVLPRNWHAEAVMQSAGGASFSGDFLVAAKTHGGRMLEIVVVDVSGKGLAAGTRSLQLSGAFGGLLGSLPTEEFLPAANAYLLRQEWAEGFASAIHLAVDLETGVFDVRSAGHPPAVKFQAGSGRWVVRWTSGPVLGVVTDAEYHAYRGELKVGDAMLLYSDGLVEAPNRDIAFGIDKLLGEAERLVQKGFAGGAERLVSSMRSRSDDCALLLLYRT